MLAVVTAVLHHPAFDIFIREHATATSHSICLHVPLLLHCSAYLEAEVDVDNPDRPVYLLGESFGAVLALAVASAKTDLVDRLVLVNPATSYETSIWPRLGPVLAKLPDVSLLYQSQAA